MTKKMKCKNGELETYLSCLAVNMNVHTLNAYTYLSGVGYPFRITSEKLPPYYVADVDATFGMNNHLQYGYKQAKGFIIKVFC